MKKRDFLKRILSIMLILVITLLAGCGSKSVSDLSSGDVAEKDSSSDSNNNVVIRVGTQPTTVGTPLDYAMQKGWFDEAGIKIERVLFPTGAPINEAIAAEQLDIALNGLATVYAVAAGDVTWIGEINSASGLNVYVRPDNPILEHKGEIKELENVYGSSDTVKGIEILGPLGTAAQFNAITWTGHFGVSANDYKMLSMDYGPATQAFLAGEGDAIASSPPYTYQLAEAGMVPVAAMEEVSGITLMDGICVRNKYLESNRDDVKKFMGIIYKAQEELGNDDTLVFDTCLKYYNDNGREYDDAKMNNEIKERDFVDEEIMSDPDYRFGSVIVGMGDFYVKDGKIDPADAPNIKKGLDPTILEEIYGFDIKVYGE